jgi:glutamine synthetase
MHADTDLLARVEHSGVRFLDLQFSDIVGAVKSLTIPTEALPDALDHGVWFDGSSVEGFARIAESDLCLMPDPATFAVIPWLSGDEATGRLICHVRSVTGEPYAGDPRGQLARVLASAAQMGFVFHTSPEVEYFLLKPAAPGNPAVPHDSVSYFDVPDETASQMRRQLAAAAAAFGIVIESMHHEVAAGQHEIDFRHSDALSTADNLSTFRFVLMIIAQNNGLQATFLPKPIPGLNGSGMHVHQSLAYKTGGRNAFFDPGDPHGLSQIAKHFIAGQLAHADAMCAVLAPLVNSYKRLVAGFEAPTQVSWARVNRGALIRVPRADRPQATRVELRCPDSGCNPYLALAVMLAAGLDGIRRRLTAPPASDENLARPNPAATTAPHYLPRSLEAALNALEKDVAIQEALGAHIYERFVTAKRIDISNYSQTVSPWELEQHSLKH